MKEKISKMIKRLFAVGEIALMSVVTIIILAYIAAFILGGNAAVIIDSFLFNSLFPVLYFIAVALAFIGIIYLYLTGYKTFRFESINKKAK